MTETTNEVKLQTPKTFDLFCFRIFLALLAGLLLPIQASLNAGLIEPLNNPIAPAAVSFVTGTFALCLVFPYDPRRSSSRPRQGKVGGKEVLLGAKSRAQESTGVFRQVIWKHAKNTPKYLLLMPALIGAFYVSLAAILGKEIGFSLFFVCIVSGQLLSAALTDHFGLFHIERKRMTVYRVVMMTLVLLGAVLSAIERIIAAFDSSDAEASSNTSSSPLPLWKLMVFVLISLLSGLLLGIQAPMNHKLTVCMHSLSHRITWWSFLVGSAALIAVTAISACFSSVSSFKVASLATVEGWQYLGGPLGAIYVFCAILLAPRLGVSLFFVVAIAGQLLCSLLIDSFGLLNSRQLDATPTRVVGMLLVFFAMAAFRFEGTIKSFFCSTHSDSPQSEAEEAAQESQSTKTLSEELQGEAATQQGKQSSVEIA